MSPFSPRPIRANCLDGRPDRQRGLRAPEHGARPVVLDGKSPGEQDAERGRDGNRALALVALQRCGTASDLPARVAALSGMLADVRDAERFAEVGEFIVDCATGPELLDQVRRTNGRFE